MTDEAAYISDEVYVASGPMLAATQGDLVVMRSAHEPCGVLLGTDDEGAGPELGAEGGKGSGCAAIFGGVLAEERRELGHEVYSREYDCEFGDVRSGIFQRATEEKALSEDEDEKGEAARRIIRRGRVIIAFEQLRLHLDDFSEG